MTTAHKRGEAIFMIIFMANSCPFQNLTVFASLHFHYMYEICIKTIIFGESW